MKDPTSSLALFISLCTATLFADQTVNLDRLFSVQRNPGSGSLTYIRGTKKEKIDLGGNTGRYGIALVFDGNGFPPPYNQDFKGQKVFQLVFGTLSEKQGDSIPQFGAATFITSELPQKTKSFKLMMPTGREATVPNMALLLFTSPSSALVASDQEKLKGSYFAQTGTAALTPLKESKEFQVDSEKKSYTFRLQNFKVSMKATLVNPFNPEVNTLTGEVQIPVYWPVGKDAETLANRFATESLAGAAGLPNFERPSRALGSTAPAKGN